MDWLKKNQKKMLAVLGVMLMVAFLVPGQMNAMRSQDRRGPKVGTLGKETVYSGDLRASSEELRLLRASQKQDFMLGRGRSYSVLEALGPTIVAQLNDHAELFFLLWKEAEQRGISISDDVAMTAIRNREVPPPFGISDEQFLPAVKHFLMAQALRDTLTGQIKVSEPMWKHHEADMFAQPSLSLVEFAASKFKLLVKPPTTQESQSLYDQYKSVAPSEAERLKDDPLGFAYMVPNRVKVQYLQVPRQQIVDTAMTGGDPFQREKRAYKYYLEHESDFVRKAPTSAPATQPAATQSASTQQSATTQPATRQSAGTQPTQPATQVADASTTKPAATQAAAPTTRPFEEVKGEILTILVEPEAAALQQQVIGAIKARMESDWLAWRLANPSAASAIAPTTAPTTQPTTSPAPPPGSYQSYAYLEQLALEIQKQFKVLPSVRQIGEWEDQTQLSQEPGIGLSTHDSTPFARAATADSAPFVSDPALRVSALQLWQPSDTFADPAKDVFIFRLTDASPAHSAPFADVKTRVEDDAQTKIAYEQALAAANAFVEAAKKDGFTRAALDDHLAPTSTGMINLRNPREPIPNFSASQNSQIAMFMAAHELVREASPENPHPIKVIPMPAERKVVVAKLSDVFMPGLTDPSREFVMKLFGERRDQTQLSEGLAEEYFKLDAVAARVGYHAEKQKESD